MQRTKISKKLPMKKDNLIFRINKFIEIFKFQINFISTLYFNNHSNKILFN